MCDVTRSQCLLAASQVGLIYHSEIVPSVHADVCILSMAVWWWIGNTGYVGVLCSYTLYFNTNWFSMLFSHRQHHNFGCFCVFQVYVNLCPDPPNLCSLVGVVNGIRWITLFSVLPIKTHQVLSVHHTLFLDCPVNVFGVFSFAWYLWFMSAGSPTHLSETARKTPFWVLLCISISCLPHSSKTSLPCFWTLTSVQYCSTYSACLESWPSRF